MIGWTREQTGMSGANGPVTGDNGGGFGRDERGAVAILFGLTMIPIVLMIGAALDYTRASAMRSRLNHLMDRAALAAVKAAAQKEADCIARNYLISGCSTADIQKLGVGAGTQFVKADHAFQSYGKTIAVTLAKADVAWSANLVYAAELPASMTKVMGMTALPVKGTVTSNISLGTQLYLNVHLLLDRSMSMGIGATSDDITRLQALTGCAFGCHSTADAPTHYFAPKAQGIRFRIDDLRDAATTLVATAKTVTASNARNHIQIAAYGFNHVVTPLIALTSDLNAVGSAIQSFDMPDVDDGTQIGDAINWLTPRVPTSGDGMAADRPQQVVILVTDGVEDGIYTGWEGMTAPTGLPLSWWGPSYTKANTGAFPTGVCDALKQKDVIVGVVYTTYVPFVGTEQYDKLIGPFAANISPNLEACASTGYFFVASKPGEINAGMQHLFNKAMAESALRLTH
ncbi:MAG: hypothetical protein CTY15_14765 [Methylocystis sp.]|nr:MAG: hypothetical protein CTY15_14765 [Methylocystis sp.]